MINLSSMDAISPKGRSGGNINLDVNNLSLDQAGMRTVSVGGWAVMLILMLATLKQKTCSCLGLLLTTII